MLAFIAAAAGPVMVAGFALSPGAMTARGRAGSSLRMSADGPKRVLVIGGTRFSGLYLTRELHARGHEVSISCVCVCGLHSSLCFCCTGVSRPPREAVR